MPYVRLPNSGSILLVDDPSIWPEAVVVPPKLALAELKGEAKAYLGELLPCRVYAIVRRVSRSGMQRVISFHAVDRCTGELVCLNGSIRDLIGWRLDQKDSGLVVHGCGMDMAWHTIEVTYRALGVDDSPRVDIL